MELRNCPFCGVEDIGINKRLEENLAQRGETFKRVTISERYQIKCRNCHCGTYFSFYLEDAIEAWNSRFSDDLMERMEDDGK